MEVPDELVRRVAKVKAEPGDVIVVELTAAGAEADMMGEVFQDLLGMMPVGTRLAFLDAGVRAAGKGTQGRIQGQADRSAIFVPDAGEQIPPTGAKVMMMWWPDEWTTDAADPVEQEEAGD